MPFSDYRTGPLPGQPSRTDEHLAGRHNDLCDELCARWQRVMGQTPAQEADSAQVMSLGRQLLMVGKERWLVLGVGAFLLTYLLRSWGIPIETIGQALTGVITQLPTGGQ